MPRFWNKERRDVWKDLSSIFSPLFIAIVTGLAGLWWQSVTASRAANQKVLELAIGILQSEPKDTTTDRQLRDWALAEFNRQTKSSLDAELKAILKDRPDVFKQFGSSADRESLQQYLRDNQSLSKAPSSKMPTMPIPEGFQDDMAEPAK